MKMAGWSAVWAPQVMSMANGSRVGWFRPGDIIQLPSIFDRLALAFAIISLCLYAGYELLRWKNEKIIHWSKHFHLLNNAIIWYFARLALFGQFSGSLMAFLIMCSHSLPYTYLGFRYVSERKKQGEKFWPNIESSYLFFLLIILASYFFTYVQFINWTMDVNFYLLCLFITLSSFHYVLDSFMWKKSSNPEGAAIFTMA